MAVIGCIKDSAAWGLRPNPLHLPQPGRTSGHCRRLHPPHPFQSARPFRTPIRRLRLSPFKPRQPPQPPFRFSRLRQPRRPRNRVLPAIGPGLLVVGGARRDKWIVPAHASSCRAAFGSTWTSLAMIPRSCGRSFTISMVVTWLGARGTWARLLRCRTVSPSIWDRAKYAMERRTSLAATARGPENLFVRRVGVSAQCRCRNRMRSPLDVKERDCGTSP